MVTSTSLRPSAADIMSFLQEVTGRITFIEKRALGGGYEISTDIGSAFELQVYGDTEEEAALAYFWHARHAYAHKDGAFGRIGKLLSLGPKRLKELDEKAADVVRRFDAYATVHRLRPPPPPDED